MNLRTSTRSAAAGNILMVTLFLMLGIGLVLVACLKLIQSQNQAVARSQAWNSCIPLAEAGVEEAMAHLNNRKGADLAFDGWILSGGQYVLEPQKLGEGYYATAISNAFPTQCVIVCTGYVLLPALVASADQPMLAAAFKLNYGQLKKYAQRTVRVVAERQPQFVKAMVARDSIDMNGNSILTDSYDSTNPLYSTPEGLYDPAKAGDHGDVSTAAGLRNILSIGNANIKGKLRTGPGGSAAIGPNGVVGDLAWHASGKKGLQPDWFADDLNVTVPDVQKPFDGGAFTPTSGTVNSNTYKYLLESGNYEIDTLALDSKEKMAVTGNAVLLVNGDVDISGGIELIPPGSLTMYVAGRNTDIGGDGVNNTGRATNFTYYGLPGNRNITLPSNGDFIGVIYAPNADFKMSGGGSTDLHFCGACITRTITVNGHYAFHYDEALGSFGPSKDYVIVSWEEL